MDPCLPRDFRDQRQIAARQEGDVVRGGGVPGLKKFSQKGDHLVGIRQEVLRSRLVSADVNRPGTFRQSCEEVLIGNVITGGHDEIGSYV